MLYGTASSGGTNGRGTRVPDQRRRHGLPGAAPLQRTTTDHRPRPGQERRRHAAVRRPRRRQRRLPLRQSRARRDRTAMASIFAIKPDGLVVHRRCTPSATPTARGPLAELLLGTDGKLYGTTAGGGVDAGGTATAARHVLLDRPRPGPTSRGCTTSSTRTARVRRAACFEQAAGVFARPHQQRGQLRLRHDLALQRGRRHGHRQHALRPEEQQQQRRRQRAASACCCCSAAWAAAPALPSD